MALPQPQIDDDEPGAAGELALLDDPAVEEESEDEEVEAGATPLTAEERAASSDPLKLYVRALGDGRLLTVS